MEKSYLRGILGALLGGLIASIPWVLVYVYANMIYSILAVLVALGALKGYQLFNGKVDKKLPIIIVVVSLLSITISTLVIIPCLLLSKSSGAINMTNLQLLYSNSEFVSALIENYVISILFTILGISGVVSSIRRQIIDSNGEDVNFNFNSGNSKKDKEKVKDYFLMRNAINEDSAIKLSDDADINMNTVNFLQAQRIILKKDEKYYYSVEEDERLKSQSKKTLIITFSILGIVIAIILGMFIVFGDSEGEGTNKNQFYYSVPSGYKEYVDDEYDDSWIYVPKNDLSGDSGYFSVYYLDESYSYSDEFMQEIKDIIINSGELKEMKTEEHFKNKNNLDVMSFDYACDGYYHNIYYIIGGSKIGVVGVIYFDDDNKDLKKDAKEVVNSFKWIK